MVIFKFKGTTFRDKRNQRNFLILKMKPRMEKSKANNKRHGFRKKQKHQFQWKKKKSVEEVEEINDLEKRKSELVNMNSDEIVSFKQLPLSKKTLKGLREAKFAVPTKVQRQSLLFSLCGLDIVVSAKTGSGKTLGFIIPLLEMLYCKRWTSMDGLGALIITPTRELAYQIFEVLNQVGKAHDFSAGLVIGGKDLKYEWDRIGVCNILICTPGRLLQHMTENSAFASDDVQMVILDEADQCLSMGFADTMNCILQELPTERQTLLFSATQTRDVKDLIRAGCNNPVYCSVHEHSKTSTPKNLKESYIVCDPHDKFTFLWSFIRHHKKHKILVFLATCKQVKYANSMFSKLQPGLSVMCLHGSMHQLRRMAIYDEFCHKKNAVLFATDVAARGLDIPAVDWVVQADCPEDVTTYIHRAGRTARYTKSGEAILLLTSSEEEAMVANLMAKNIPIEKIHVDPAKLHRINVKIEVILSKYTNLKEEAVRALKAYVKHVFMMKDKKLFDVMSIDINAFARSLGLAVAPRIRFLEKMQKQKLGLPQTIAEVNQSQEKSGTALNEPKLTTLDFGADDSDDDDDDFLSRNKKQIHVNARDELEGLNTTDNSDNREVVKTNPKKPLTKLALIKKALKKKLQFNQRVMFDEEGEVILDPAKEQVSKIAREDDQETGGINIDKMMKIMEEEDLIDKKVHAERMKERNRLKKKAENAKNKNEERNTEEEDDDDDDEDDDDDDDDDESDDFSQNIIDELPDPDRYYGNKDEEKIEGSSHGDKEISKKESDTEDTDADDDDDDESDDFSQNIIDELPHPDRYYGSKDEESSNEESDAEEEKPKVSGKRQARDRAQEAKRARMTQSNTLESLPVDEQEELALFLLRGRK